MPSDKSKRLSRRDFLQRGSLVAGGLCLIPSLLGVGGCGDAQAAVAGPVSAKKGPPWELLKKTLSGTVVRPSDKEYLKLAVPKNLRYAEYLPSGIVRCKTHQDVQTALDWAQCENIPFVVRSGGYSGAGFSTTKGLLIDLSLMNSVTFDETTGLVTVGGGARVRDLSSVLRKHQVSVTHGNCQELGLGGLVLGGGLGFDMRRHGLTCDQLVATDVVTATGEVLQASREKNQDLFWACRGGGGGNFGVNTAFTLQTFPVDLLTVFRLEWTTDLDVLLPTLLALLPDAPDELGGVLRLEISAGGTLTLSLQGQFVGEPEELRDILDIAYELSYPKTETMEQLSYWEGRDRLWETGDAQYAQERSHYAYSEIPLKATELILEFMRQWPKTSGSATWTASLTGGAIDRVNRRATAYVHRGASLLSSLRVQWNVGDSQESVRGNVEWMDQFHLAMVGFTSGESSQNYVDPSQDRYLESYYGENLAYLVSMKRRYDPSNVFRFAQSVPPSVEVG